MTHTPTIPETRVQAIQRDAYTLYSITLFLASGESLDSLFHRLQSVLDKREATLLKQTVLGDLNAYNDGVKALQDACGNIDWPVTWIEGKNKYGKPISGMTALAVSGLPVERVLLKDRVIGSVMEDKHARHLFMGNLFATNATLPETVQTKQLFDDILAGLDLVGMDFSHVIRTWYYLQDILAWYDDFNAVRTGFFQQHGIFEQLVPASTGIGGANPWGTAATFEAIAIQPKSDAMTIQAVESPKQCSAMNYGSSFSRAVEVAEPGVRTLYISGTASIAPGGESMHNDNLQQQIETTFEVVRELLHAAAMSVEDITRSVAYFKDASAVDLFHTYYLDNQYHFPIIEGENAVCRDELLFEIEVDASRKTGIAD
jgi:enamine deaminase RidA (YjgF/YER057c/UK114 family)